jgi:hypothetical protein
MIKVENIDVWGFDHAIRGMRNPKNSWDKSDTIYGEFHGLDENGREILVPYNPPQIGQNDLDLMKRLYKSGTEHRTYARMIQCSMDIIAPLYWWKEMDRYTVGKSQVSCSTMHKIAAKEFDINDFSHEHIEDLNDMDYNTGYQEWINIINCLNYMREKYLETKDKKYWWQLIQLLPSSYNQRRTVCMSYETVFKIIKERIGHKLDEWNEFVYILKDLPYVNDIME